jgi:hypothetical protein
MSVIRAVLVSAAFAAACAAPGVASAMAVPDLAHVAVLGSGTGFAFGAERLGHVDAEAAQAAQDYFNYDSVITLGALALAGGALAALGARAARREAGEREPAWREGVMRAVQADLAQFTATFRRAA